MLHCAKQETLQFKLFSGKRSLSLTGPRAPQAPFLFTETNNIADLSGSTLGIIVIFSTTLIPAIAIALAFGWQLALVCVVTIPVLLECGYFRLSVLGKLHQRVKKAYKASASYASEAISEIRTVAALTRENAVWQRYHTSLTAETR